MTTPPRATTTSPHWREQLASLATLAPGWVTWDDDGPWGLPPDEGAITTARRFLGQVGEVGGRCVLRCNAEPNTGDICLTFWGDDGTLSVYVEAGLICQMLAYRNPLPGFVIDRRETPFAEAVAIVREWLDPRERTVAVAGEGAGEYPGKKSPPSIPAETVGAALTSGRVSADWGGYVTTASPRLQGSPVRTGCRSITSFRSPASLAKQVEEG